LVVAAGVDGQFAEQFAGGGVDDADVEVVDEHEHVGSGVGSSDAEVVQSAGHAQGDHAAVVDAVVADAGVGVCVSAARPSMTTAVITSLAFDTARGSTPAADPSSRVSYVLRDAFPMS
jgi:hypothetical protein